MKVALIIQFYYSDLLLEYIGYINTLKSKIYDLDIYVDITEGCVSYAEFLWLKQKFELLGAVVFRNENRGKDIGSFLTILNHIDKQNKQYDHIIKLHTKKSLESKLHDDKLLPDEWRTNLILPILNFDYAALEKGKCYFPSKEISTRETRYSIFPNLDMSDDVSVMGFFEPHHNGQQHCSWASPNIYLKCNIDNLKLKIKNNHIKSNKLYVDCAGSKSIIDLEISELKDISLRGDLSTVTITSDYFIPKNHDINSTDIRHLSFELLEMTYLKDYNLINVDIPEVISSCMDNNMLSDMLKIANITDLYGDCFCAGTMFIYDYDILKKHFINKDFQLERGNFNDAFKPTRTHYLERLFGSILTKEQFILI